MSALPRRCCAEREVMGKAGSRCRGHSRSIVLDLERRGFILVDGKENQRIEDVSLELKW